MRSYRTFLKCVFADVEGCSSIAVPTKMVKIESMICAVVC
jgi:hypothetical protein